MEKSSESSRTAANLLVQCCCKPLVHADISAWHCGGNYSNCP